MYFKNSRFTSLHTINDNEFCISHSLLQQQIYGDERISYIYEHLKTSRSQNEIRALLQSMYSLDQTEALLDDLEKIGFITGKNNEVITDYVAEEAPNRTISGYRLLRILLTDVCNLACAYCKVMPNIATVKNTSTSNENLEAVIKMFFGGSQEAKPKIVHISGGEPLIHWDKVVKIVELVSKYKRTNEAYFIVIGSNATLLNENRARYIAENNIKVIVSLDGRQAIHDTLRKNHAGKGSYTAVNNGIKLLNEFGISLGISMVIGAHNVETIDEEIGLVIETYNPISLGVNFMKPPTKEQSDFAYLITPAQYVRALYSAYKQHRDKGVFFELVFRKLTPFVKQTFRYHDCGAAAGTTINIDAHGNIGPCKSFLIMETVASPVGEHGGKKPFVLDSLGKRSPFYHTPCHDCRAISICGNACAYEAWTESDDMMNIDLKACRYTQLFFDEMKNDLGRIIAQNLTDKPWRIPSSDDRHKLYGAITVNQLELNSSIGHEME